jgi:hypothetical protein
MKSLQWEVRAASRRTRLCKATGMTASERWEELYHGTAALLTTATELHRPCVHPVCFHYIILPLVLFSEGPCLIHSMNGDLLRTLEGPENCLKPKLIQASREGHCVIFYENGCFCTFSVNGKLQATVETDDHIRVSAVGSTLFLLLGSSK